MSVLIALAKKIGLMLVKKTLFDLTDKEKREKIGITIILIASIIVIVFGFIYYVLTSPLSIFSSFLGIDSESYKILEEFKKEYGYVDTVYREIPLYIQTDSEWSSYPYAGSNIAIAGCGTTSLAMVLTGLTGETVTPIDMASYSTQNGYAVNGIGTAWGLMTTGALDYVVENEIKGDLYATQVPFTEESILDNLSQGKIMITSMKRGIFTRTGHFIVLTGLDTDGKVTVNDSYSRDISSMSFDAKVISRQSKGAWAYNFVPYEEEGDED